MTTGRSQLARQPRPARGTPPAARRAASSRSDSRGRFRRSRARTASPRSARATTAAARWCRPRTGAPDADARRSPNRISGHSVAGARPAPLPSRCPPSRMTSTRSSPAPSRAPRPRRDRRRTCRRRDGSDCRSWPGGMVASAPMRHAVTCLTLVLSAATAAAQTIRVAAPTEVARETDPARFSEPHLAVDPSNPDRLLAAVIVPSTMNGPLQQQLRAARCAVFASRDGGRSWTRHDFPYEQCGDPQVAVLPDGQAIVAMLARYPGVRPDRPDWLIVLDSADAGWTWDAAPALLGTSHDHDAVAVDMSSSNRRARDFITDAPHGSRRRRAIPAARLHRAVARRRQDVRRADRHLPNNLANISEMPVVLTDGPSWRRLSTPPRRRPRTATMRSSGGARGSSGRATARPRSRRPCS